MNENEWGAGNLSGVISVQMPPTSVKALGWFWNSGLHSQNEKNNEVQEITYTIGILVSVNIVLTYN